MISKLPVEDKLAKALYCKTCDRAWGDKKKVGQPEQWSDFEGRECYQCRTIDARHRKLKIGKHKEWSVKWDGDTVSAE